MKRLNSVMAVLTNPVERANYDRSLDPPMVPCRFTGLPSGRLPAWPWPAAGAIALLSLLSFWFHLPAPPPVNFSEPLPGAQVEAAKPPVPRPSRSRAGTYHVQHRRLQAEPSAASSVELPNDGAPWIEPPSISMLPPPTPAVELPAPSREPSDLATVPDHPTFSGEWLYVPAPGSKVEGLYPPEFIELRINQESGILRGRYRARYRIPDRAISPTVSFQFEGRAGTEGATLPWTGIGGARGQVSLRLLPSGGLQVTWAATQLGEELGLISGTATLVRRLE